MTQVPAAQTRQKRPNSPITSGILQRKCACGKHTTNQYGECNECSNEHNGLQRSAGSQSGPDTAPAIVHEVLSSPGRPLDPATRAFMEPRFGHDFSRVRVHTDTKAAESAREVNALAYTVGSDVVFGTGQYGPGTSQGQRLLAHELTHVVQQKDIPPGSASVSTILHIGSINEKFEREAGAIAESFDSTDSITTPQLRQTNAHIRRQFDLATERFESPSPLDEKPVATLPYREATELAKCIRIMGEENTAYCRQKVLGEVPPNRCTLGTVENPVVNPMADIATFQSPGASGWWGAKFGCYRNGCTRRHRGWDIHAATGTPIFAVVTGTMTRHNDPVGYGQYVILTSAANPQRQYRYSHLSRRESSGFYCPGDKLGETGVTGNASANRPHLHFEVRDNGAAVDPAAYLTEPNQVIGATGSGVAAIDKTLPPPCTSC